jgi:putative NADPH-quinone reductase
MKVLIVFAHPEPRSLNGALRDVAIKELKAQGHEVRVSDLYADGWKSEVDRTDFPKWARDERFIPGFASKKAFESDTLTKDVKAEIEKLLWADMLIMQFPLWWYAMPAILKGWVDRVFAYGFAYGVGEHSDQRWGDRFGEGTLLGKRAMLIVTTGGGRSIIRLGGSTARWKICSFPSITGFSTIPVMTSSRLSWSTKSIVSTKLASSQWPNDCANGCERSRPRRRFPIVVRITETM